MLGDTAAFERLLVPVLATCSDCGSKCCLEPIRHDIAAIEEADAECKGSFHDSNMRL